MRTVGVRHSGKSDPHIEVMYKVDQLEEALSEGDYVVNILPLTSETRGLFDKAKFAAMKNSAFFVNVGRGPSVVTDDLIEALQSGALAGAGLDVFEEEPLPSGPPTMVYGQRHHDPSYGWRYRSLQRTRHGHLP